MKYWQLNGKGQFGRHELSGIGFGCSGEYINQYISPILFNQI